MAKLLVSASTGPMGLVLGKLGTMMTDEYRLLKNVREYIKVLKDELESMHAFLMVMANIEKPNEQAKLRVDVVREMSYDIEGNIDKSMIHMKREPTFMYDRFMQIFDKSMKKIKEIKIRHKIAKDIKRQVKEINETYARYKIDESSRSRNGNVDPRLHLSELVGIDGPRDELVKWLSNKEGVLVHQPKVLSIVGHRGLGKTTLAKQVYDKLKAKYECQAFVSISRSPDMTQILSSILSQLRNKEYTHAGADQQLIINKIRDFLKDRRSFIVIDDIWDIQTWQTLDCALSKNGSGSVIMTTTRIHDVAKSCCSQGNLVYKMQPLDVPDSKRLFFKRIFGCEEKCPSNLKETAEDILKKCGGLPLAINAISSLLATGTTNWDRVRGSIRFAQGNNSEVDAMDYILSLIYFHLPLHLRSCLLYLTMFPEDYEIERQQLVLLWISEGLIHGEDEKDSFQLGETYFHELVNRSLIQPVDIGGDGKADYCRVHNTVIDFLICKATEENFCTLLSNHSNPDRRIHRLSLLGNEDEGSVEQLDLSHARTLIAFPKAKLVPSLVKSNALRVLDLRNFGRQGNHHVKDIGRLFQLRYLNLYGTYISELPEQIGDLECLETLDARQTKLVELPESVTRLQRLAHLFVDEETKFPDGIGNMKNLQELHRINPLKQSLIFVEELGKLTNLKKLHITWDTRQSCSKTSVKEEIHELLCSSLRKLESCKLATTGIDLYLTKDDASFIRHAFFSDLTSIRQIIIRSGALCWISNWLVSLANLEMLSTSDDTEIGQQDVDMVGSIPTLVELYFWSPSRERIIINSTGGFGKLCELRVTNDFVFEAGAMPNLKNLTFRFNVEEFKLATCSGDHACDFSYGIYHLPSLAQLRVLLFCPGMRAADVEGAEDALKSMAHAHPNRPMLEMEREHVDYMLGDDDDSDSDEDSYEMSHDDEDLGEQDDEDSGRMLQENETSSSKQTERKRKREQKS